MPRLLIFLAFMAAGTGMMYLLTVREAPRGGPAPPNLPFNVIVMTDVAVQQQEEDHPQVSLRYRTVIRRIVKLMGLKFSYDFRALLEPRA